MSTFGKILAVGVAAVGIVVGWSIAGWCLAELGRENFQAACFFNTLALMLNWGIWKGILWSEGKEKARLKARLNLYEGWR